MKKMQRTENSIGLTLQPLGLIFVFWISSQSSQIISHQRKLTKEKLSNFEVDAC